MNDVYFKKVIIVAQKGAKIISSKMHNLNIFFKFNIFMNLKK